MSTHLAHAFSLHLPDSRLSTLQAWAEKVRAPMLKAGQIERQRWLVQEAVRLYDLATLGLGDRPESGQTWLQMAYREGRTRLDDMRYRRSRCPDLDTEATVVLFEDEQQSGNLHGLFFIDMPFLRKMFLEQPEVLWCPYQDQTDDIPVGVSEDAWQARATLWRRLIPTGIPAASGVTVTLVDDRMPLMLPDEAEAQDVWPTLASRSKQVLLDALVDEFYMILRASGEAPNDRRWRDCLALTFPDSPWMAWMRDLLNERLDGQLTAATLLQPR